MILALGSLKVAKMSTPAYQPLYLAAAAATPVDGAHRLLGGVLVCAGGCGKHNNGPTAHCAEHFSRESLGFRSECRFLLDHSRPYRLELFLTADQA